MIRVKNLLLFLVLSLSSQNILAIEFSVFGDITLSDSTTENDNVSFALGALDFYATQEISDNTRAFIELVFENNSSGLVTDLERFWIMHSFVDELNVSAGRFHTPLGRWNRTYHHGALVQDTVSRPSFLDFEDGTSGILPVHIVGIMLTGDFFRSNDEITYELAVGNGPSIDTSNGEFNPTVKPEIDINIDSDNNDTKSVAFRIVYGHDAIPLKFGLFSMVNEVSESAASGGLTNQGTTLVSQVIYGMDTLYTFNSFEFLAEYYQFENQNKVGNPGTFSATAWYMQLSYKINHDFKLIARTESLHFDSENDTYFRVLGTEEADHNVLALRYDIDESNALKFEINYADSKLSPDATRYILQWSFLIP